MVLSCSFGFVSLRGGRKIFFLWFYEFKLLNVKQKAYLPRQSSLRYQSGEPTKLHHTSPEEQIRKKNIEKST